MSLLQAFPSSDCSARIFGFQFQIGYLQSVFERGKPYNSPLALLISFRLHMDLFGWILLILFCDCWLGGYAVHMGRRLLSDVHRASPVLFEIGYWDMMIYFWAIWAVITIIAISMARSKNTGKGESIQFLYGKSSEEKKT